MGLDFTFLGIAQIPMIHCKLITAGFSSLATAAVLLLLVLLKIAVAVVLIEGVMFVTASTFFVVVSDDICTTN